MSSRFIENSAYADVTAPGTTSNVIASHDPSVIAGPDIENVGTKQSQKKEGDFNEFLEPTTLNLERNVLWAKIESIEFVGYEQVYDIEVEGTHNFVANGIIAHNTFLSGNVGIGTTGPGSKLTVAGGDVSIDNTKKVNLEGATGDTYIYRTSDNRVVLAVDGIEVADWIAK